MTSSQELKQPAKYCSLMLGKNKLSPLLCSEGGHAGRPVMHFCSVRAANWIRLFLSGGGGGRKTQPTRKRTRWEAGGRIILVDWGILGQDSTPSRYPWTHGRVRQKQSRWEKERGGREEEGGLSGQLKRSRRFRTP